MSIVTVTRRPSKNDFRLDSFCANAGVADAAATRQTVARCAIARNVVNIATPSIPELIGGSGGALQARVFSFRSGNNRQRRIGMGQRRTHRRLRLSSIPAADPD